ncbi:MAG TPA: PEP-CTERM sorting domain-containing protein [Terriglobales bacterium]|nr:PEP-CTERM sorting domain-containing protein [Terriglobales bacterium]
MHSDMSSSETNSAKRKTPCELPEHLHRRLNSYALAASAAGVAVLACSVPAYAAPVCKTLHVSLVNTDTYALNPAHQQVPPFNIAETWKDVSSLTTTFWNRGFFIPNWPGAMALLGAKNLPADVPSGASIGPGGRFGKGQSYGLLFTYGPGGGGTLHHHKGNLQLQQINYIGFEFPLAGENHYGWVRLRVTFKLGGDGAIGTMHIHSYGHETTPNTAIHAGQCSVPEQASEPSAKPAHSASRKPIMTRKLKVPDEIVSIEQPKPAAFTAPTPEPATLGLLAIGSHGLSIWRREK